MSRHRFESYKVYVKYSGALKYIEGVTSFADLHQFATKEFENLPSPWMFQYIDNDGDQIQMKNQTQFEDMIWRVPYEFQTLEIVELTGTVNPNCQDNLDQSVATSQLKPPSHQPDQDLPLAGSNPSGVLLGGGPAKQISPAQANSQDSPPQFDEFIDEETQAQPQRNSAKTIESPAKIQPVHPQVQSTPKSLISGEPISLSFKDLEDFVQKKLDDTLKDYVHRDQISDIVQVSMSRSIYNPSRNGNKNGFTIDESFQQLLSDDSQPIHEGVKCSHCGDSPIKGIRYKCEQDPFYNLCSKCQAIIDHDYNMIKMKYPEGFCKKGKKTYIFKDYSEKDQSLSETVQKTNQGRSEQINPSLTATTPSVLIQIQPVSPPIQKASQIPPPSSIPTQKISNQPQKISIQPPQKISEATKNSAPNQTTQAIQKVEPLASKISSNPSSNNPQKDPTPQQAQISKPIEPIIKCQIKPQFLVDISKNVKRSVTQVQRFCIENNISEVKEAIKQIKKKLPSIPLSQRINKSVAHLKSYGLKEQLSELNHYKCN